MAKQDATIVHACETKVNGRPCGYKRPAADMCVVHVPGHPDQVACVNCARTARTFGLKTENLATVQQRATAKIEAAARHEQERQDYWKGLAEASSQDHQADAKARRAADRQRRDERAVEYQARRDGATNGYAHV